MRRGVYLELRRFNITLETRRAIKMLFINFVFFLFFRRRSHSKRDVLLQFPRKAHRAARVVDCDKMIADNELEPHDKDAVADVQIPADEPFPVDVNAVRAAFCTVTVDQLPYVIP